MNYNRSFTWLRRSIVKDTQTGQDVEVFTENGILWGSCEELKASKRLAYGMANSQADLEIHLRQWPTVDMKDRLRDRQFGKLLIIDGVTHEFNENELVVYAHSLTNALPETSSSSSS